MKIEMSDVELYRTDFDWRMFW